MNSSSQSGEKASERPGNSLVLKPEKSEKEGLLRRARGWLLRALILFRSNEESFREAITEVLEENPVASAQMPPEEKKMLTNVLHFSEKSVRDIMVPRSQVQAVEHGITLDELKALIADRSHTRIPVYKETLDNVKGFLHVKDLFSIVGGEAVFDMTQLLRDVLFVPPSMKVLDLLVKMRLSRVHMAIVVDEFGGTDGLVTMEDLFEEIVGEIQDEHDDRDVRDILKWSAKNSVELDAKTEIGRIEKELSVVLRNPEEEKHFDTLGGLIFAQIGRVPVKGEKIDYPGGISFEILDGDARRIKRIRMLHRPQATAPAQS